MIGSTKYIDIDAEMSYKRCVMISRFNSFLKYVSRSKIDV